MKYKRRKIGDGEYAILDADGQQVGTVWESGNRWYRWHVTPADKRIRGWDSETVSGAVDGLAREIAKVGS